MVLSVDLSISNDITSLGLYFVDQMHGHAISFLPEEVINDYKRKTVIPFSEWVSDGDLISIPGRVIDYRTVVETIKQLQRDYVIRFGMFDSWRMSQFEMIMEAEGVSGIEWISVGQNFKSLSPYVNNFENLILESVDIAQSDEPDRLRFTHSNCPVLKWCVHNTEVLVAPKSMAHDRRPDKSHADAKIDSCVALIMATGDGTDVEKPVNSVDDLMWWQ